jgi:uncharacterized protein (DUF58 family)
MAAAGRSSESITGRGLRRRVRAWFLSRLPLSDTWTLTQRNIYILPTKAGLVFCATLVIMLLASINYQLNLGYVLTFLLAGSGVVSMHLTHGALRGLTLHVRPGAPVVAGDAAVLDIVFTNPGKSRHALALHFDDRGEHGRSFAWVDIPAQGQETARVSLVPATRGWHAVPTLMVETVFPFGLFRAWTLWRPATRVLAYPRPETPAPPLPAAQSVPGERPLPNASAGSEMEGVRPWRRGDSMRQVAWKKMARTGEMVSRDTAGSGSRELWLDWSATNGHLRSDPELRLSRLAAWVMSADRSGATYGMRMPGREYAAGHGDAHRRTLLETLALWP